MSLQGPWPVEVEGQLEIAEISDAGGQDYCAFGWIETADGDVSVHALGGVLEAGRAADGGPVQARVRPADGMPKFYEIVEVMRVR